MPTLCVKRDNWQLLSDKTIIVIITPDTVTAAKDISNNQTMTKYQYSTPYTTTTIGCDYNNKQDNY